MGEVFAIDIHSDRATAVLVEQEKALVLKGWLTLPVENNLAETLSTLVYELGYSGRECRIGIGEEFFSFRQVSLPFSDRAKLAQVLPFELDDRFSLDADSYHFDFQHSRQDDGFGVLVALIKRETFAELLACLKQVGLDPSLCTISGTAAVSLLIDRDAALSDFLLLDIEQDQTLLSFVKNRRMTVLRSLNISSLDKAAAERSTESVEHFCDKLVQMVNQTFIGGQDAGVLSGQVPTYLTGSVGCSHLMQDLLRKRLSEKAELFNPAAMQFFKVDGDNDEDFDPAAMSRPLSLAMSCYHEKTSPLFNLRRGLFKKQLSLEWVKKYGSQLSVCIAGIVLAVSLYAWWDYRGLYQQQEQLKEKIEAVYRETLPGATKIVNPVQQLQLAINEVKDTYRVGNSEGGAADKLVLLADISARVPQSLPMTITRFVADFDNVNIKAETDEFNKVDEIKKAIEKSVLFSEVGITSANLDPKSAKVRFDLKLVLQEQ